MVIKVTNRTKDGELIELTVTTNKVAHSIFSDTPYLQEHLIFQIQHTLELYLKKEKENEESANTDN